MFDSFTDWAKKAIGFSRQEAQRLKNDFIGTEHMSLGIAKAEGSTAVQAMAALGVSPEQLLAELEKVATPGEVEPTRGQIPFTPRAREALQYALEEASNVGVNYISTGHLLLGILRSGGSVALAFDSLGLDADAVRGKILELDNAPPEAVSPERRPVGNTFWGGGTAQPVGATRVRDEDLLVLRAYVGEFAPETEVVDSLVKLYQALNEYVILSGGPGLVVDDWQILVSAPQPVEA